MHRFSAFTYWFQGNNNSYLIYHAINGAKAILNADEFNMLTQTVGTYFEEHKIIPKKAYGKFVQKEIDPTSNQLLNQLYDLGFISTEIEDQQIFNLAKERVLAEKGLHTMFLVVNQYCNIACTYCYEEKFKEGIGMMSWENAKAAIETFARESFNVKGDKSIFYYGGEPLVNFGLIRKCVEYVQNLKSEGKTGEMFRENVTTNGTLITRDIAKFFAKHQVSIGLSLDGTEHHHNAGRPTIDGEGSFKGAIRGLKYLQEEGVPFGVICTVGNHNVDDLPQIAKYFCENLGIESISFNLLLMHSNAFNPSSVDIGYATSQLIKAFDVIRSHGCNEGKITKQLIPFRDGTINAHDCDACGSQVVVTPDGKIGPCLGFLNTQKLFVSKNLESNFNIRNIAEFSEFHHSNSFTTTECYSCPAISVCGGGCQYNRFMKRGTFMSPESEHCEYMLKTLEWMTEKSIDGSLNYNPSKPNSLPMFQ